MNSGVGFFFDCCGIASAEGKKMGDREEGDFGSDFEDASLVNGEEEVSRKRKRLRRRDDSDDSDDMGFGSEDDKTGPQRKRKRDDDDGEDDNKSEAEEDNGEGGLHFSDAELPFSDSDSSEGEDLMETMMSDYKIDPRLDTLDPELLDEKSYGAMHPEARRLAEESLRRRDRQIEKTEGLDRRLPAALRELTDSEEDDEEKGRITSARRRRRRRAEKAAAGGFGEEYDSYDEDFDFTDPKVPLRFLIPSLYSLTFSLLFLALFFSFPLSQHFFFPI